MHQALLLALVTVASAQSPSASWRTARTEGFVVHYPAQAESWALDVAARLDDARRRVAGEVGWSPTRRVHVVVRDPYSDANGSAWPFLRRPRMQLWATPPTPDSVIGNYRSWTELLVTHEDTHLVHLLRPSRNRGVAALGRLIGLGPIALKSPRWVAEGYATVIEARLTGSGRPNGDLRAAVLRGLAEQGRLPTYGELNAFDRFMGGSFAYLVGSAYLEWLEERAGEGALRDLWSRMSARRDRTFEDAFEGVWGEGPEVLYARFTAELTHAALQVEQPRDSDTLFESFSGTTASPAVSPDGMHIAVLRLERNQPGRVEIWSTAVDEEAVERRADDTSEMLEADPQDVPAIASAHPPHASKASLTLASTVPSAVRWLDDDTVLMSARVPFASGRYRADLFSWDIDGARLRRLTHGADLHAVDPFPDGRRAVAVRYRWGEASLVVVDLESGEEEVWESPDAGRVVAEPRVSPTGDAVAWLEQSATGWSVVVREVETGRRETLALPDGDQVTQLAWIAGGSLVGSVGRGGFTEIREISRDDKPGRDLTRTGGLALSPAPAPDGTLFHLVWDDDGLDLHQSRGAWEAVEPPTSTLPIVRPPAVEPDEAPVLREVEGRPYGLGPAWVTPLMGGALAGRHGQLEVGVRVGDLVGRHEQLAIGSWGSEGAARGGLAASVWRVAPAQIRAEAFAARMAFGREARAGGLLGMSTTRYGRPSRLDVDLGILVDAPLAEDLESERRLGYLEISLTQTDPRHGAWGLGVRGRGQVGRTGADDWGRAEGRVSMRLGRTLGFQGAYTAGWTTAASELDQYRLGGTPTSVVPGPWLWSRVTDGAFAVGSWSGSLRDEVSVRIGSPIAGLYGCRHRMGDTLGGAGASVVGLNVGAAMGAEPFQGTPGFSAQGGVACQIEEPREGWATRPCQSADDYRLWMGLVIAR